MAKLKLRRLDADEAARQVVLAISEEVPAATAIRTAVHGDPGRPKSFIGGFRTELAASLGSRRDYLFDVTAEGVADRPFRVRVRYVAAGRGAMALTTMYLTRLGRLSPGAAMYGSRGSRGATLDGDPAICDALASVKAIQDRAGRFMRAKIVIAGAIIEIDPFVGIVSDADGALLTALSSPRRRLIGSTTLDLASFLDIAARIEAVLGGIGGSEPVPRPLAPLPPLAEEAGTEPGAAGEASLSATPDSAPTGTAIGPDEDRPQA